MQQAGKYIIVFGAIILIIGLIIYFLGDKFSWFGNLPGDFKYKKDNVFIYFPLTSMLILSIVLTIILNLLKKFF
jgi:hypothetical protein